MEQKLIPITELIMLANDTFVFRKCYFDANTIWKFREILVENYNKEEFATLIVPAGDADAETVVIESIEKIRSLMKEANVMEVKHKYERNNKRNDGDWRDS